MLPAQLVDTMPSMKGAVLGWGSSVSGCLQWNTEHPPCPSIRQRAVYHLPDDFETRVMRQRRRAAATPWVRGKMHAGGVQRHDPAVLVADPPGAGGEGTENAEILDTVSPLGRQILARLARHVVAGIPVGDVLCRGRREIL